MQSFLDVLETVLNYRLFTVQNSLITPLSLLIFVGVVILTFMVSRWLRYLFERRLGGRFESGVNHTIRRMIHYTVLVLGLFVALNVIGINMASLAIVAGGVGVGIGFGLQTLASNFASGLILMFERPIEVGDVVTVDDDMGRVEAINLRATEIQTLDNLEIIVPNSSFIEGNVINWSHSDRNIRVRCPAGVSYDADIDEVMEVLEQIARDHEDILEHPEPTAFLTEFGGSSINFELRFWIDRPGRRARVLHEVNVDMHRRFADHGIEMPYPQRDLHLRSSTPLSVEGATET